MYAYSLNWHLSRSNAFKQILSPFDGRLEWRGWDNCDQLKFTKPKGDEPIIFCQLPPPEEFVKNHSNIVWIPMGDYLITPKYVANSHVRIVALSNPIYELAKRLNTRVFQAQFAPDPLKHEIVSRNKKLFYWNRVNLFNNDALVKIAKWIDARSIIVNEKLDTAGVSVVSRRTAYPTIHIHETGWGNIEAYNILSRMGYFYLAPRKVEGVGLSFIEAMASGQVVLSLNNSSMNEYIVHGENGLLFDSADNLKGSFSEKDFLTMSRNAREAIGNIHLKWQARQSEFIEFIMGDAQ